MKMRFIFGQKLIEFW